MQLEAVTEAFIRERLESVVVRDDDYRRILEKLSHSMSQEELDAVAFWLELQDEWPDTDWEQPDPIKDALREIAELPFGKSPIPLFRGHMTNEKLEALYAFLKTAYKIESRFMEEHDGEAPSEFVRTIAISLFIEENKRQAPAIAPGRMAVPKCPKCGGEMYDNRGSKKNPKAPDFKCKDTDCLNDNGFVTGAWERDYDKDGKLKPRTKKDAA